MKADLETHQKRVRGIGFQRQLEFEFKVEY